jgi:ligand-binding sensor domain-containing protein
MGRLNNNVFTTHSTQDAPMPRLPGNDVKAFYEDSEGGVWIGTERNGLYRVRAQAVTVYSIRQGLQANNIYSVLEDRSGAVWVGAWDKGLSRIKDGAVTNYSTADGLPSLVTAIHEDREGRLWIGGYGGLRILQGGRVAAWAGSRTANSPTTRSGTGCSTTASFKSWRTGAAICG